MIKAVFFDLYNTLAEYDPPREEAHAAACRELGIEVDPQLIRRTLPGADDFWYRENCLSPIQKRPEKEKMGLYAKYENLALKGAGVELKEEVALQILLKLRQTGFKLVLYPDVLPTLRVLKQRSLTLGLISNIDREMAPLLQELGLFSYLSFGISAAEVGSDKSEPTIFLVALERAGVRAEEAIHVGDSYYSDVLGARRVGIKPLLIDRYNLAKEVTDCDRIEELGQVVNYL